MPGIDHLVLRIAAGQCKNSTLSPKRDLAGVRRRIHPDDKETRVPQAAADEIDFHFARQIVGRTRFSVLPVTEAQLLPPETYISEKFWAFEKYAIFSQEWLCVAHVNEVPNIGDYLPLTVLNEPVVVVRDEKLNVRVLSAICRHRGHPLAAAVVKIRTPADA